MRKNYFWKEIKEIKESKDFKERVCGLYWVNLPASPCSALPPPNFEFYILHSEFYILNFEF